MITFLRRQKVEVVWADPSDNEQPYVGNSERHTSSSLTSFTGFVQEYQCVVEEYSTPGEFSIRQMIKLGLKLDSIGSF